ncbi:retrovirus-related pol polyprotein from transposon TNT 1-94 [Tanacetum coccineum]
MPTARRKQTGVLIRNTPEVSSDEEGVHDEPKGKSIGTHEGTDLKLGVPNVSKDASSESKYESWGDSDDDADDEEYERINEELYGDVNVRLTDAEFNKEDKGDAEMADATQDVAQVTITAAPATQDATTDVPSLSSSHFVSSNYASIFFNLDNLHSAEAEVVSMLDINVQHEVQNKNGVVSRNKARLVAQGYNQQEDIDYDETYSPIARLESIRILLAYACALDFKLFQMDVKSTFLNGSINEEVYVAQPPGFIDFKKPDHVYKLKKALYGLKQAPKPWYDRLKAFLIKHEYKMGMVDNTLFTKKKSSNLIIGQIYVDDIIFGLTCQDMYDEFAKIMHDEFEMSMMGELNFFLGLHIEDGIFFNQSKYIKEMLKKFSLEESKPMKTSKSSDTKLTKDEECKLVDSTKYRGMISSLLYLTASRPDIMFSVCLCAFFEEAPKTSHLKAVKRIF